MSHEFIPRNFGNKNCDDPITGIPHPNYDYLHRTTTGDEDYPIEWNACERYLQVNGRFTNLLIDTQVTSPTFNGNLNGVASGNKLISAFDIPHVKDSNKRIRHIVAEGPEPGIYIRGKLKDSHTINLPEYWDGLIDPDSITVTLTQIGHSQDLIVDSIDSTKEIVIRSGTGRNIHCFYEVWAARWLNPMNHEEKLEVVYEGKTPNDYPGSNENFLVGGWDYDRRETQWKPQ